MTYLQQPGHSWQRLPWLGGAIALHVALIAALLNGLDVGRVAPPPPPMPTHLVTLAPPPPPVPPALAAPDLAAPPDLVLPHLAAPLLPLAAAPATPNAPRAVSSAPSAAPPSGPAAGTAGQGGVSPMENIGGDPAPAYPETYADAGRPGRVTVDCVILAGGAPADCRIIAASGGPAFANETLRWLNGPRHPVYRPSMRNGHAEAAEHQWSITFQPPG